MVFTGASTKFSGLRWYPPGQARKQCQSSRKNHDHDHDQFRLLVKLPSILGKMKFTMMSAKNVHKYLELVESFVASQTDLFVEDSYK